MISPQVIGNATFLRILEPVFLGSVANIVINYLLNPLSPGSSVREFVVAILLAAVITEVNRCVEKKLDKKYKWVIFPRKRFFYHLTYLAIILVLALNIIGNIYMWVAYQWFYSFGDLVLINGVTFLVALFLVIFRWTNHFFLQWKNLSEHASHPLPRQTILVSKGRNQMRLNINDIRFVKIEFGVVKVFVDKKEFYVYKGILNELANELPESLFFPVSRNILIHRSAIRGFEPSSYGKLKLIVSPQSFINDGITVSRPKAARFRRWLNSN